MKTSPRLVKRGGRVGGWGQRGTPPPRRPTLYPANGIFRRQTFSTPLASSFRFYSHSGESAPPLRASRNRSIGGGGVVKRARLLQGKLQGDTRGVAG